MSNDLSPERLAEMRAEVAKARESGDFDHAECRVMGYDLADLLAHIDAQAATIQRVRDLLIPSFYDRAEANRLLNKIQAALDEGDQE